MRALHSAHPRAAELPATWRRIADAFRSDGQSSVASIYEALATELENSLPPDGTANADPYLSVRDVAQRYRLSEYTVCEYAKAGRITPAEKAGNRWRFPPDVALLPSPTRATRGGPARRPVTPAESLTQKFRRLRALNR